MSKTYINGYLVNSSTNHAAAVEYTEANGNIITVQEAFDNFLKKSILSVQYILV